jgi:beta propeller repeat protein
MKSVYVFMSLVILSASFSCSSQSINPPAEFQIATESHNQHLPAIYGDIVVWEDWRNGNADIYGYNISTGEEFKIISGSFQQEEPAIFEDIVVWSELNRIRGYDLQTHTLFSIDVTSKSPENPAIFGDIVVWEDDIIRYLGIHGYNLKTHGKFFMPEHFDKQKNPAIWGDIVLWEDRRNYRDLIYGYDIETGEEFPVNPGKTYFFFDFSQHNPAIFGDVVIWTESNGDAIYGYNLSTRKKFPIALSQISRCKQETKWKVAGSTAPAIYGDMVVWVDCRNGNEDIFAYDLSTGEEFQVTFNEKNQRSPAVYENIVVWEDNRNGQWDIYGMDISTLTPSIYSASRTKLILKGYLITMLVSIGMLFFTAYIIREIYYIVKFYSLKKHIFFKKEMLFRRKGSPTTMRSYLVIIFYVALFTFYAIITSLFDPFLIPLTVWVIITVLCVPGIIWIMMVPFVYVSDDHITVFPTIPGKWKTYERKSIQQSTFQNDQFDLHLVNGKNVAINVLKAHEDDQIFLLKSLKDFLKRSM